MTPARAIAMLIAGSAIVRLICSYSLGLGNDEAYHSLYAANPALSYFDHPPMMAWVERAGLALPGAAGTTWGLRIGFIGLFGASTWLLARLTARQFGGWAGFHAALALNLTGYYGLAASTFALPDGPLLFFWILTIDRLTLALNDPGSHRLRPWLEVGLAWGGALLSKYHGVFIPAGTVLFLLLDPPMRRWFFRPGPYLAFGVGLLLFSPVIAWNAGNGWVSFFFQGGRAVGSWVPRPDYLLIALIAQAAYLFPWIWLPLIQLLVRSARRWNELPSSPHRLWLCLAVVPFVTFTLVACFRLVLPHWGLIGLISMFPLLGQLWSERLEALPKFYERRLFAAATASIALVACVNLEYRHGWLQRPANSKWGLVDQRTDPTIDLYGWDQVVREIKRRGLLSNPTDFIFTRYWYQSAQLAHAAGPDIPVLCYNADDPRGFAFWSKPREWVGRNGVLVMVGDELDIVAQYYAMWFRQTDPVAEFWIERAGKPVRRIRLYSCKQQVKPFPYALDHATRLEVAASQNKTNGPTTRR